MGTATPPRRLVSLQQAADYVGCSTSTIRRLVRNGDVPGYRIAQRIVRVDLHEVDAALRGSRSTAKADPIGTHAARVAADAPPLTDDQVALIADILRAGGDGRRTA